MSILSLLVFVSRIRGCFSLPHPPPSPVSSPAAPLLLLRHLTDRRRLYRDPLIVTSLCRATFFLHIANSCVSFANLTALRQSGAPLLFWIFSGRAFQPLFIRQDWGHQLSGIFLSGRVDDVDLVCLIFSVITVIEDRERGFLQGF